MDPNVEENNLFIDFGEADFEELVSSPVIWDATPPCSPLASEAPSEYSSTERSLESTPSCLLSPLNSTVYDLDLSNVAPPSSVDPNCHAPSLQPPNLDITNTNEASPRDARLVQIFAGLIAQLQNEHCSFAEWLLFLFHDERRAFAKSLKRASFWEHPDYVQKLLNCWTHSRQTASGRVLVDNWAKKYIAKGLQAESRRITSKKILHSSSREIGPEYLETFQIQNIREEIQKHCSTSVQMLLAIAGVDLSQTTLESAPVSARNVAMYCMASMLREANRLNNLLQVVFGLYMYAAGLQRQAFTILSHIGLLVSYTLLVSGMGVLGQRKSKKKSNDTDKTAPAKARDPTIGPLKELSDGCLKRLRRLASPASGKHLGFIFDNINLVRKVAEQVLGRIY